MNETGWDDTEPGLATTFIKRSSGDITREIAAQGVNFVVNPEGELRSVAPKREGADDKNYVAERREKTERWTGTPRKHMTSPRLGGKNQPSS
ncbi:MAG TPA: hypothetical protein VED65_00650 [Candidatus Bathyarchaeia archaeon]|nr:hypothetical protein [Candidatus Bathyarchaeia archaeon]